MKTLAQTSCAFLLCAGATLLPVAASAQASAKPDATPPKLEKLEEAPDSGITISKPEAKNKITEKRANGGKVTEVQVKSGKSNYTLKANPEFGNAPKGTVQGDANRGAQWTVLEFGGGKKEGKEVETAPVLPPASAQPAPASAGAPAKK